MDEKIANDLAAYVEQLTNGPFGNLQYVSNGFGQRRSEASRDIADNLLRKASRALGEGNTDRARALVDRAVRLPFDTHEEAHPAAIEAHMQLFTLITDELEVADAGDSGWLLAAVDAMSATDEAGRTAVRTVLAIIDNEYDLRPPERASLRSAIGGVPAGVDGWDLRLEPAELRDHVLSTLTAARHYLAALDSEE